MDQGRGCLHRPIDNSPALFPDSDPIKGRSENGVGEDEIGVVWVVGSFRLLFSVRVVCAKIAPCIDYC